MSVFLQTANTTKTSSKRLAGEGWTSRQRTDLSSVLIFLVKFNLSRLELSTVLSGTFTSERRKRCGLVLNLYYLKLMFSSCLLPNQPTYVTAESNIKDRFALGVPSACTQKLSMMFQDQLVALNEIVKLEQDLEAAENKVCSSWEEFVRIH